MAKRPRERLRQGRESRLLRLRRLMRKIVTAALSVLVILFAAAVAGALLRGLGFWGVMITVGLAALVVMAIFYWPDPKPPAPEELAKADLGTLAGKTEIWLEHQRPSLPAPAAAVVDRIGIQLDQLAPQLARLDENEPTAWEVRRLVGEHLPGMISSYQSIPEALRGPQGSGKSPESALVDGLVVIEREIDGMTRQIAQGDIDRLSTTGRYLESKYSQIDDLTKR